LQLKTATYNLCHNIFGWPQFCQGVWYAPDNDTVVSWLTVAGNLWAVCQATLSGVSQWSW